MATIGEIKAAGERLSIFCPHCGRLRYLSIHRYENDETLEALAGRLKCIRCLEPEIEVRIMRRDPNTGYWPAESI